MKNVSLFGLLFFPLVALASPGQYVCRDIDGSSLSADAVAKSLNSMSCDTTKPVTSMTYGQGGYTIICCVQK